jgi:hypothetical protein
MTVLDADEVAATAATIVSAQRPDGSIPWYEGGPWDPWNHVEAAMGLTVAGRHEEALAAYRMLRDVQNPDGSFSDDGDSNFTAYVAVGVRHHLLTTGDTRFLDELWPVVTRAMDFVVRLQRASGEITWRPGSDVVLLAGCSSIHHALRCALTVTDRADWRAAADSLRTAIVSRPDLFTAKPHAMDWYYPVLGGAVDRLANRWEDFVVPGLGVRCVHDQPWVTGGETAELALTLAIGGRHDQASRLLTDIQRLRCADGSYWTGYQYADDVLWPDERTTWTAGAMLLANAAVARDTAKFSAP